MLLVCTALWGAWIDAIGRNSVRNARFPIASGEVRLSLSFDGSVFLSFWRAYRCLWPEIESQRLQVFIEDYCNT